MIHIYDKSLDKQCIITNITSLQWTRRCYDAGNFELHFAKGVRGIEYLREGYVVIHGDKAGIITYQHETIDDVEVQGYDLTGILAYRCCNGSKTGDIESVMKSFVADNAVTPTDTDRKMSVLQLKKNQNRGSTITWAAEYSNLLTEIASIGATYEMCFDIGFDTANKNFMFDVYKGTDRTISQSVMPPVVFSRDRRSISDYDYEMDCKSYVNTVYMHNDTDGDTVISGATYTGLDRREIYEDYSDSDEMQSKADKILTEKAYTETIEAESSTKFEYNVDWFLGDYVTVKIEAFGNTLVLDKQITEVEEVHENNNTTITPTFGTKNNAAIKLVKLIKGV